MKKLALPAFAFFTLAIFTFQSCDKDKGIKGCNSDFDQTEMFANVADNIICLLYTSDAADE